jgi:leucyl/phenylalanyl-tRNA--protein transferase
MRPAYFPMSEGADDPTLFWVDPQRRGVFPLDGFHVSRSLRRRMRKGGFEVRVNSDFLGTVEGCADANRHGSTPRSSAATCRFTPWAAPIRSRSGKTGRLSGGVFGVVLGGAFFGESMFSRRKDASKIALAWLIARLNYGGFRLFDTQFVTEHLETLGAVELPRRTYRDLLSGALETQRIFTRCRRDLSAQDVLAHLSTQTS